MDVTRAVFHSEGITPNLIEVLKSLVTADVMLRAVSLSIRAEMSSCMPIGFATVKTTQQIKDFLFSAEKFIYTVSW